MVTSRLQIIDYDTSWPARFRGEAERLQALFGSLALRVEHVGSTAVTGLSAKPVIDIQISVACLEPRATYERLMTYAGYAYIFVESIDTVYPFYARPGLWPHSHHVHLCRAGSQQERDHLAFRDYLRSHSDVALEYAALKRHLAQGVNALIRADRERYSQAKTDFIEAVLRRTK